MKNATITARKDWKKNDDLRDSGLKTPENIARYDNILYGMDKRWNLLDVYLPKEYSDEKLPVLINVHGGGWVYGTKETYQYYCMSLAEHGFAVINFNYRLAPENKFPASIEDMNMVVCWMYKNADKYAFDLANVFAVGDSAGGHILGLYSNICTSAEYAKNFSFAVPKNFLFKAIALNCGIYKTDRAIKNTVDICEFMEDFLPNDGFESNSELIDICNHMTEDFPPTVFMTCVGDPLIYQAPMLEAKLIENKIPHTFLFYGDKNTSLGHVFHVNIKSQEARLCNKTECDFLKMFISKS